MLELISALSPLFIAFTVVGGAFGISLHWCRASVACDSTRLEHELKMAQLRAAVTDKELQVYNSNKG